MKIEIAKNDLLMLREEMWLQLNNIRSHPAYGSNDPHFQECVLPQARVLAKFIRKLNRACVKAFGHDCSADMFDLTVK